MSDFITLTCPSCGGKLEITNEIDSFSCAHCGIEHVVNRGGGIISLKPVIAELHKIRSGTDRTASELAIARLRGEIPSLEVAMKNKAKEKLRLIPVGVHLRYGFQKIGKLNFWNVGLAQEKQLTELASDLSLEDVDKLIIFYGKKKHVVGWLEDYRNLAFRLQEKIEQLEKHQKIIG